MNPAIAPERAGDEGAIRALVRDAFAGQEHGDGSEPAIVDALRAAGDLALSLVARAEGEAVGHVAFSPVTISDGSKGWFGLGPLAVAPALQGRGIGGALIRAGIARMEAVGARGIVVLGSDAYYPRFGFAHDPQLAYPGPPARYFQRLVLSGPAPAGEVRYAPAFG